jgi:hypothetical protein
MGFSEDSVTALERWLTRYDQGRAAGCSGFKPVVTVL